MNKETKKCKCKCCGEEVTEIVGETFNSSATSGMYAITIKILRCECCGYCYVGEGKCCGKKMFEFSQYSNGQEGILRVCLDCGSFESFTSGILDEEEVDNYREMSESE